MSKKYSTLNFKAKVKPIEKISEDFMRCKCYAFGLGKNRNYSHVSKENMERNKYTLSYAPVVGQLIEKYDKEGNKVGRYMGGHDSEFDSETWDFKSICVPYGVVIPNSFSYETVTEYQDKKKREYLTCEVILWLGRYPELKEAMYSEDILFNESAELNVSEYRPLESDSNYTDLVDFSFSALCLLGKADENSTNGHTDSEEHTEPCFIESKVIPIEYSLVQEDFSKVMSELKEELAFYFNTSNNNSNGKEENTQMENMENTQVEDTTVDNSVEGTETVENSANETVENNAQTDGENTDMSQNTDEDTPNVGDEGSDESEDEDEEPTENNACGGGSKKKKKCSLEEYEALKNEFETYKANHSHTDEEYTALADFKADYDKKQKESLFADDAYSSISDTEEFKSLVDNSDSFSYEDCETKANAMLGKFSKATFATQAKEKKTNRVAYGLNMPENTSSSIYGDFIKKKSN